MEISRSTLLYDAPVGTLAAQAGIDCTLPLPVDAAGGVALDAGAAVSVSGAVLGERGVEVSGTLTFRPLVLDETGAPVPFTATAEFSHRIERDGLTADMRASVAAELLQCQCRLLGDALRVKATVQLRAAVWQPVETGAIACLTPAPRLEQLTRPLVAGQRRRTGGGRLLVREEVTLPHGFTLLQAAGTPFVRDAAPTEGGAVIDGTLNLLLLGTGPDGGLAEHPCAVAFSDALQLDSTEQLSVTASLLSLTVSREDEETNLAAVEATLELVANATLTQETQVLLDAYDPEQAFECEQQTAACLCYRSVFERREHVREQVRVPEGLPDAYMPVLLRVCPAVTNAAGNSVDGVLLLTVVYRCDGGQYHSFTDTLPFSVPVSADGAPLYDPRVTVQAAQATGSGRAFDVQVSLLVSGLVCREESLAYTTGITPAACAEPPAGILLYFPDAGETLFSVGKRFSIPTAEIRQLNPDVADPLPDGARLVLLR